MSDTNNDNEIIKKKIDYDHCPNCNKPFEEDEQGMSHGFHNSKGFFCLECGKANPTLRFGCSEKLLSLIRQAVDTGKKFTEIVGQIWEQSAKEGLSREEIAEIVRAIARERGGLNKDQVYYLTHKPQLEEKAKQQYEKLKNRNIPTFSISEEEIQRRSDDKMETHRFYLIAKQLTENWIEKNIPERINEISKFNRANVGVKLGKLFVNV